MSPPLVDLLSLTDVFEKIEPRDGVYALLGMLELGDSSIVPDYRKSVMAVNQEATRCILKLANNLWALRNISHPEGGPHDCSWACRFDTGWDADREPSTWFGLDFNASGDLGMPNSLGLDSIDNIVLQGLQTDTIEGVWLLRAMKDLNLLLPSNPCGEIPLSDEVYSALACAMMQETAATGERATSEDLVTMLIYLKLVLDHDFSVSEPTMYHNLSEEAL
ncbi:hypothetical protein LTR95_006658 [Oleoguttula sp. CCFEE 5521]